MPTQYQTLSQGYSKGYTYLYLFLILYFIQLSIHRETKAKIVPNPRTKLIIWGGRWLLQIPPVMLLHILALYVLHFEKSLFNSENKRNISIYSGWKYFRVSLEQTLCLHFHTIRFCLYSEMTKVEFTSIPTENVKNLHFKRKSGIKRRWKHSGHSKVKSSLTIALHFFIIACFTLY